jgi:hypothetical protein
MDLGHPTATVRFLTRDPDTRLAASLHAVLATEAVTMATTPPPTPPANRHPERPIRNIRAQCTDPILT